ncbi:hypothetical protein M8C21_015444, partial [Ambrosia artemisiifolia]
LEYPRLISIDHSLYKTKERQTRWKIRVRGKDGKMFLFIIANACLSVFRSVENASREYGDMKDTIQQHNVTWVDTRANEAYVQQLKEKNSEVGTR